MIAGVFIIKSNGEVLYGIKYTSSGLLSDVSLPSYVRSCVTLFTSRDSTEIGHPYILEQNEGQWVYVFFKSFTIIALTSKEEEITTLSRKMVALGKQIVQNYGSVISNWHGSMGSIQGIESLIDAYISSELDSQEAELLPAIEGILYSALENPELAYAGIIDASGKMLVGNIPENHLEHIREELLHKSVGPSTDIVPDTYEILGYTVQVLRVHSFTVVGAPHKDESRIAAASAVSEIAQALDDVLG